VEQRTLDILKKIKEETGADIRAIPFGEEGGSAERCVYCGEEAKKTVYFAKAY
jgi:prolyl-tRNA synthetase